MARYAYPHTGRHGSGRNSVDQAVADAKVAALKDLTDRQLSIVCSAILQQVITDAQRKKDQLLRDHPDLAGRLAQDRWLPPRRARWRGRWTPSELRRHFL